MIGGVATSALFGQKNESPKSLSEKMRSKRLMAMGQLGMMESSPLSNITVETKK